MLVDDTMLAYLESDAPQPTQASLDGLLEQVSAVRIHEGGCAGETLMEEGVLVEVTGAAELSALRDALRIVDGPGGHCMCYGGPTFEMLSPHGDRLALVGLHHGRAIRWSHWKEDGQLADGPALLEWLADQGVPGPKIEFEAQEKRTEQRQQAWNRWVEAMPDYLRDLPEELWEEITTSLDPEPILAAARRACPDTRERILALFEWYGSGVGTWTAYPSWETFAERLLLAFSRDDLIDAATEAPLNDRQTEGAARFFAGRNFRSEETLEGEFFSIWYDTFNVFQPELSGPPSPLPPTLRERLRIHCEQSTDPDKQQRARIAFHVASGPGAPHHMP